MRAMPGDARGSVCVAAICRYTSLVYSVVQEYGAAARRHHSKMCIRDRAFVSERSAAVAAFCAAVFEEAAAFALLPAFVSDVFAAFLDLSLIHIYFITSNCLIRVCNEKFIFMRSIWSTAWPVIS